MEFVPSDNNSHTINSNQIYDKDAKLDEPINAYCNRCNKMITTYLSDEYNSLCFLFIIFTIIIQGVVIAIPLIILLTPLFKNKVHLCPECCNNITVIKFYPISIKDNYVQIKLNKCVFIFKKIFLYVLVFLYFFLAIYINFIKATNKDNNTINIDKNFNTEPFIKNNLNGREIRWLDLIEECGSTAIIDNSARANEIFKIKYKGKKVVWKGHFMGAIVNQLYPIMNYSNESSIVSYFIRMIPSESINDADIILSLNSEVFNMYKNIPFVKGDPVEFVAELYNLGNERTPHLLKVLKINKIEEFIDEDQKITLFKGVNIEIKGHKMSHNKIENRIQENSIDVVEKIQSLNSNS